MLIRADARALPLADVSVQCVVTSPPYFGLRDYGTGEWRGGDPTCNHLRVNDTRTGVKQTSNRGTVALGFSGVCGVCGAERVDQQIGLEPTPDAYVQTLVQVFREVRRVLKDDGVCWLNLGDSYAAQRGGTEMPAETLAGGISGRGDVIAKRGRGEGCYQPHRNASSLGLKHKDLIGIPWRVAFALQADGWYLRSDVIWHKPNPMPESVTDRPTKAHEYLFLLTKSERYSYDAAAIAEPSAEPERVRADRFGGASWREREQHSEGGLSIGHSTRNKRSVWTIPTMPYSGAHFATMPEALVEPCILAGSSFGDLIFDPFSGSGTVLAVAERLGRRGVGTDLNPAYHALAKVRTAQRGLRF